MNAFEVMSNPAKLRKLAQTAMFLPTIIQIHETVKAKMPKHCAAERRATALGLVERLVVQLTRRGYVQSDLREGLDVVIGDLYDSVVAAVDGV